MPKHILIYEDDFEILNLCQLILNNQYQIVIPKQSCEQILQDIEECKPSLILMDLWIPKIGGEKAIRLLKSDDLGKSIPVFLFSAHAELELLAKKMQANGFLRKPFDISELKLLVQQVLFPLTSLG